MHDNEMLWVPSTHMVENSNLRAFRLWLSEQGLHFDDYDSLWAWSVKDTGAFWEAIERYFKVIWHDHPQQTLQGEMPGMRWFDGGTLNYAGHILQNSTTDYPAIIFASERHKPGEISWDTLIHEVSRLRQFLVKLGLKQGDRVAAYLPNIPEATYGFLAAASLGAIWSSCSPDFGAQSVLDRFQQITPTVLLCVDGYQYGGKRFDKIPVVREIAANIPSIKHIILVPYLEDTVDPSALPSCTRWDAMGESTSGNIDSVPVRFDHPLWVLYSSGTTGLPKAITHSHGGMLLEHLKYLAFHNDVHRGERFFWFSTTGWMMWNFVQASLLQGATIVLYDGSPGFPDLNALWALAEETKLEHFGTSAPFLIACMQARLNPCERFDLTQLRSVSSTGAPLPPEAFDWVYAAVKKDVWLCSMSGGTDVCTAFVGGCPEKPVYRGEIQSRALGCLLEAWDENGRPVIDEVGEMVITRPMPCMPVFFWNDTDNARYRESYFDKYPGVWCHGDWVRLTRHGGLIISGRSDTTLNRQGVRIGTAEIYRALHAIPEIEDALIVHLDKAGQDYMPLFVVLKGGASLDDVLKKRIKTVLRESCSPRHVPDEIITITEVPYTISGKKMESPVKKILLGKRVEDVVSRDAMRNPNALDAFVGLSEKLVR